MYANWSVVEAIFAASRKNIIHSIKSMEETGEMMCGDCSEVG